MSCGGEDVEVGHWFGGGFELGADALFGAAAFAHVAVDASVETELVGGVDVDAEVVEGAQRFVVEGEDAFDDEELCWGDEFGLVRHAGVVGEVVDWAIDRFAVGEGANVLGEECVFEGVGVVEVLEGAIFRG